MASVSGVSYAEQGKWDFRGADIKEYTHCFHIYPAMMIPQVARRLFDRYSVDSGLLFDPYCGTGTSLVEARLAGMDAIGTDINPTARMIAKAKTTDYNLKRLNRCVHTFLNTMEENLDTMTDYSAFHEPQYVTWERLQDWFPVRSMAEISFALEKIAEIDYKRAQWFLRVALSECLRLVSFQRNREFKLYRIREEERDEYYVPLLSKLRDRVQRNLTGLEQYSVAAPRSTMVKICDFNTVHTNGRRHFSGIPSVDLVVTSPPYGDSGTTVAYAQFSWLSNVWLGLDDRPPGALDREMMGGRKTSVESFGCPAMDSAISAIANVDEKRANEIMHFYHEYHQSIRNVAPHVKQGGHACFVVGNRIVKGTQLPTDQFTAWAFEQEGFSHLKTFIREFPYKRMPSMNSPSNKAGAKVSTMKNEYVVVCRKT